MEISEKSYLILIRAALLCDTRRGGIAGQAFTNYECVVCEQVYSNSDTAVPLICPTCTSIYKPKIKTLWEGGYFEVQE